MITGMPRIAIAMHDFDACVDTFRNEFGMPVVDLTPGKRRKPRCQARDVRS